MCGLVATVAFDGRPADPGLLKRASDALTHRGPDDSGIATYGPVGFGFRRLSIIDLSPAGHQPMESADGRLAIVFNGEIYNYIELKRELQQLGRTFRSSSDTEVLLHAYDAWGADCVNRFNGMWAFVIYDKERRRVFASRDRFGVKPLYRWTDGTRIDSRVRDQGDPRLGLVPAGDQLDDCRPVPRLRPSRSGHRDLLRGYRSARCRIDNRDRFEWADERAPLLVDRRAAASRRPMIQSRFSVSCSRIRCGCACAATSRSASVCPAGSIPTPSSR